MNDDVLFTIEFEMSSSGVSHVRSGRAPGRGTVEITTADGTEQFDLALFTYSVDQFLEAVPKMLCGGHGGVSTNDTAYLVFELEDENHGHVTFCFSKDAIADPERRLLPRDERPLDVIVPLSVLVDEVITAVADLLDRIEQVNESVVECEWFQDLNADLDEVRDIANEYLQ